MFRADDALPDLLAYGEVPVRWVYLTATALERIRALPDTPCDEDPLVPPIRQITGLMTAFLLGKPMILDDHYKTLDQRRGLWRWKTRTLRIGGMYLDPAHFVLAHLGFARQQKRHDGTGTADPGRVGEFSKTTRAALEELDLLSWAWMNGDPHFDESA